MKDNLIGILFGLTFFVFFVIAFLWWKDIAIKTEIIYRPGAINTVVDTIAIEEIHAMWEETVEDLIDSLSNINPDTVYLSKNVALPPDTVYLSPKQTSPWQEKILRLAFKPPALSFVTAFDSTAEMRRLVYSDIPWGFIVYPDERGYMHVQNIEPPPSPVMHGGYNWGLGVSWANRVTPAIFGEYYIGIGKIRFTGLMQASASGVNAGLYLRW